MKFVFIYQPAPACYSARSSISNKSHSNTVLQSPMGVRKIHCHVHFEISDNLASKNDRCVWICEGRKSTDQFDEMSGEVKIEDFICISSQRASDRIYVFFFRRSIIVEDGDCSRVDESWDQRTQSWINRKNLVTQ